jgi:hypothetical protein
MLKILFRKLDVSVLRQGGNDLRVSLETVQNYTHSSLRRLRAYSAERLVVQYN